MLTFEIREKRRTEAREAGATSPKAHRSMLSAEPAQQSLHEIAAPILRVAEKRFAQTSVRRLRDQETFVITAPIETCEEILRLSLRCIDEMGLATAKEERHEVGDL
jgi:hypothetical protein